MPARVHKLLIHGAEIIRSLELPIGAYSEKACNKKCDAARCPLRREEADTLHHVLLRCPALMATRLRVTGYIHPTYEEALSGAYVAAAGRGQVAPKPRGFAATAVITYCH